MNKKIAKMMLLRTLNKAHELTENEVEIGYLLTKDPDIQEALDDHTSVHSIGTVRHALGIQEGKGNKRK